MNVERCRRMLARTQAASAAVDRRRRLAAMTPEHRAKHERTDWLGGACLECLTINWPKMFASTRTIRA